METNEKLKGAGLKITFPRITILGILEKNSHLSAEDIYQILLEEDANIGLATIYRVLTQFEDAGLVLRHNFEGGKSVFELSSKTHHDHMVCIDTNEVIEFQNDEIEQLQHKIVEAKGYELINHSLVLYVRKKQTNKLTNK